MGRRYGFAFACMARQERGCRQIVSLPSKENGGPYEPPRVLRATWPEVLISLQGTGTRADFPPSSTPISEPAAACKP